MAEVRYSIYCLYTDDNKIYIGMSKNAKVRIQQHEYKSCDYRLKALIGDPNVEIFSQILHTNLTKQEASLLEKRLIKQYKNDSQYTLLNIQSGGLRGGNKILSKPKISKWTTKWLTDDQILKLRYKYSYYKLKIDPKKECIQYNVGYKYFMDILKGRARNKVGGPILGKDYTNG